MNNPDASCFEGMRLKEELRLTQERLNLVLDSTSVAVWDWNPAADHVHFSPRCFTMLGYEPDELEHSLSTWVDLLHPDDREDAKRSVADCIERGEPFTMEFRLRTKDGQWQWTEGHGKIVASDTHGRPARLLGIHVNIHERKRIESALLKSNGAAEAAGQAKSEFLANMSHEIRTPLNGIMGMLQLLQLSVTAREDRELCALAMQAANRLTQLLSDILDLSALETGKTMVRSEQFDLPELLQKTIELFMPVAVQTNVCLKLNLDHQIPHHLLGDHLRLQQVLTNLIGNAYKFTQQGHVSVELHRLPHSKKGEQRVFFTISDTGCGIPDEALKTLFQPFTQVGQGYTKNYQGAGLGLTLCKQLVKLMGGNMAVESETGAGTSVHFCVTFGVNHDCPCHGG